MIPIIFDLFLYYPRLARFFEKNILNQILVHFDSHNLMQDKQYGFTKGRSTTDAGIGLIKNIYEAWEGSQDALGMFCDLSKAFMCTEFNIGHEATA